MTGKAGTRRTKTGKEARMRKSGIVDQAQEKGLWRKGKGFRKRFLEKLTARKDEVEKALDLLVTNQKEYKNHVSADELIEEFDHAEREISAQTYYHLLERKNKELEKIEILIQRVQDEEEFGICEECGKPIPEERLTIVPEATCCVPCQRELEKLDMRRTLAERSSRPTGGKKDFRWEEDEDSNEGIFILKPDLDNVSLMDLEETDLGEADLEEKDGKNASNDS